MREAGQTELAQNPFRALLSSKLLTVADDSVNV